MVMLACAWADAWRGGVRRIEARRARVSVSAVHQARRLDTRVRESRSAITPQRGGKRRHSKWRRWD
jgi:hypothetical protein